jgi:hypothetical protein
MYDEDMTEDDRDAEQDAVGQEARGGSHVVTLDVTVRIKVDSLGSAHESDDIFDMVTGDALCDGDILNVEEV